MWLNSEGAVQASGVSWTILRPSGFMSNALRWKSQLQRGDVVRAPFANAAVAAIDPRFFVDGEFDDSPVVSTVADLTKRQPRTFQEWASAARLRFVAASSGQDSS
jgi:uncharacterized protein YbjT (DUF2867 family)